MIYSKFFIEKFWLINANGMRELQNHHFVTSNEIVDLGKHHQLSGIPKTIEWKSEDFIMPIIFEPIN